MISLQSKFNKLISKAKTLAFFKFSPVFRFTSPPSSSSCPLQPGLSNANHCNKYKKNIWTFCYLSQKYYPLQHIQQKINGIYALPNAELQLLLNAMERVEFAKNHIIISADKVERYLYFIEKGIARAYCYTDKQEATFWFGQEGDLILSYNSYINQQPGYENIELLEDSILYRISDRTLQELYTNYISLANWGRKLAEQELIKTEERLINRQFRTAIERYNELITETPSLIRRVQLGHIASYLGVTQVTLSRIRAELR